LLEWLAHLVIMGTFGASVRAQVRRILADFSQRRWRLCLVGPLDILAEVFVDRASRLCRRNASGVWGDRRI
jgi:hypothetical protein